MQKNEKRDADVHGYVSCDINTEQTSTISNDCNQNPNVPQSNAWMNANSMTPNHQSSKSN